MEKGGLGAKRHTGATAEPQEGKLYFSGNQLCSLPPPAGGCAELVAMRKIAPPRIKYH